MLKCPTMSSTVSSTSMDHLNFLFHAVQQVLIKHPTVLSAFLPIFWGEIESEHYDPRGPHPSTISSSDSDLTTLLSFFQYSLPRPSISSAGLWQGCSEPPMKDLTTIAIHGRLAAALRLPQSDENFCLLQFIIIVIILHQLAHAVAARFQGWTLSLKSSVFPYHVSCRGLPVIQFPEHGFSVEEGLFGGIIGIIFQDEVDASPPMFFYSDFTRISYLFLHCRDGSTYRLDPIDLKARMDEGRLDPFDLSKLVAVPSPKRIRDRMCAMFNGDHLKVEEPQGGDPEPFDMSTLHLQPTMNKCGIRRP
ncbi:hypothetical protein EW146_g503 [Bondarzewia mesenterica]|uniref:Uncharacterized protein n=1 Tax=Bondarzewia mesenterica TaxID=1095465 RepID=A0A4S4MD26_9AGAM|nr:hypothetical protein EW146_g503 [Bondarzewia mesenterica]